MLEPMDSIWTQDSLILFLIFFIPGFISQKIFGLIVPDESRDNSTVVTSAVAYKPELRLGLAAYLVVGLQLAAF